MLIKLDVSTFDHGYIEAKCYINVFVIIIIMKPLLHATVNKWILHW